MADGYFSSKTKKILAKRAGERCSICKAVTSKMSHHSQDEFRNLGQAAHVKGRRLLQHNRFDENMTDEQRSHISNGIWLCNYHAKDIDSDSSKYTVEYLNFKKLEHEMFIEKDEGYLKDDIHCKYLVTRKFEILKEIANFEFSIFPTKNVLLVQNKVFSLLKTIVDSTSKSYRNSDNLKSVGYESQEEYLSNNKDLKQIDKSESKFPYYDHERNPSIEEVKSLDDFISNILIKLNVPINEIVKALFHFEGCGGSYLEEFLGRPIWTSFLSIENISENPIKLQRINGLISNEPYRKFHPNGNLKEMKVSESPILPGQTVIIPLAIILPPIHNFEIEDDYGFRFDLESREQLSFNTLQINEIDIDSFNTLGTAIYPNEIKYEKQGKSFFKKIHDLDLGNVYAIDRYWNAGCCPHLFYMINKDVLIYEKSLFTKVEKVSQIEKFVIPKSISKIIISEIEDEISTIEYLKINDLTKLENEILNKNERIEVNVNEGDMIEIKGFYKAFSDTKISSKLKNDIIGKHMNLLHSKIDTNAPK